MYCDLDYPEMICAMEWLGDHRGAQVVKFAMPEPATTANVLAAYDEALRGAPNARLLLDDAGVQPDRTRDAGAGDRRHGAPAWRRYCR